jgi:Fe-S-cluster-containing hydrogenase component 2
MENRQQINIETCNGCGLCIAVCPMGILHTANGREHKAAEVSAERSQCCIGCAHCMAICPTGSILVDGLSYDKDIFDLEADSQDAEAFVKLAAGRRSVRVFKKTPVPRDELERIVEIISMAPMGFTPHKVEITVVPDRETIERALPIMMETYEKLGDLMANPIGRFFIRRKVKPETFNALKDHVLPSMRYRLPDMRAGKGDTITRGAPAMLLFHAHRESCNHSEDMFIALTYGLLAAHSRGLGATAISLVPPAVERSPELRAMFQIPPDNEVLASMIVGYPKFRFKKGIRRELAGVHWV